MATFGDFSRLGLGNFGGGKLTTGKLPAYGAQPDPNAAAAAPAAAAQPKQWGAWGAGGWGGAQAAPKPAPQQAIQPNGQITTPAAPAEPTTPMFWPNGQPMVHETADAYASMGYKAPAAPATNTGIVPPGTAPAAPAASGAHPAWGAGGGAGLSGLLPPNLLASIGTGVGDFYKNGGWADTAEERGRQVAAPFNKSITDAMYDARVAKNTARNQSSPDYDPTRMGNNVNNMPRPATGRGSLNQPGPRYPSSMTPSQIRDAEHAKWQTAQDEYHANRQNALASFNANPSAAINDPKIMDLMSPEAMQWLTPEAKAVIVPAMRQKQQQEIDYVKSFPSGYLDPNDPRQAAYIQRQIDDINKNYAGWYV